MVAPPPLEDRWLSDTPLLGFDGRPHRHRLGLRRLDPGDWLDPDRRATAQIELKRRLAGTAPADVLLEPESPAAAHAAEELERSIVVAQGSRAERSGTGAGASDAVGSGDDRAIVRCGLRTQEDWCLMLREDTWRLRAAFVCFPSRWVLAEKIGATVAEIHDPVPGYRQQLDGLVELALDRLRPERPAWRLNWNIWDDPRLFQPVEDPDACRWPLPAGREVGERLVLRIERQTLRRLSDDAVAFGIRVHQRRLSSLVEQPNAVDLLAATLGGLSGSPAGAKKLGRLEEPLRDWTGALRS